MPFEQRNQDATVYVGSLEERVTEALVYELFTQVGPVVAVAMPRDRLTGWHQGYAFVEFANTEDADYAIKVLNLVRLFGKPIRVNKSAGDKIWMDIGATLFIGGLDSSVDERLLHDTFSAFGPILGTPRIARDPSTNESRGFGFVSYSSFEASDAALEAMHNQYLNNKPIQVMYALRKDGNGERHGSEAERRLAAQARESAMAQMAAGGKAPSSAPVPVALGMPPAMAAAPPLPPGPPMGGFAPAGFVPPLPPGPPAGFAMPMAPPQWGGR
ncbi:Splicing factor 3B subunit 4 [Polyrhizophydium stewartii]|uniref:Splicing factor 3B subunit 4 n=1 Tax=Polyrhizophydium stewartii TaxID=2732419 RepID=A0ABR4N4L6_9FUNG